MSSIVKKAIVAITGLALIFFLIAHLAGNLLIYVGVDAFNAYAHTLESKPFLIIPAEIGLIIFFLLHIFMALKTNMENSAARPVGYEVQATGGESTLASRSMRISGIIVAIFVILHVKMFKFSDHNMVNGLYGHVVGSFQQPLILMFYLLAMGILGLHLSHGAGSAFQTLGLLKPSLKKPARRVGQCVGWLIALGFATLPLFSFLFAPKQSEKANTEQDSALHQKESKEDTSKDSPDKDKE